MPVLLEEDRSLVDEEFYNLSVTTAEVMSVDKVLIRTARTTMKSALLSRQQSEREVLSHIQ